MPPRGRRRRAPSAASSSRTRQRAARGRAEGAAARPAQSEHFLSNLATSDRILLLVAIWIGLSERLARDAGAAARAREPATP
jgi:hypothetical protein